MKGILPTALLLPFASTCLGTCTNQAGTEYTGESDAVITGVNDTATCNEYCVKDSDCQVWTLLSEGLCHLWYSQPATAPNATSNSGSRCEATVTLPECELKSGVIFSGAHDAMLGGALAPDACRRWCYNDPDCKAWNMDGVTWCRLFYQVPGHEKKEGHHSGLRCRKASELELSACPLKAGVYWGTLSDLSNHDRKELNIASHGDCQAVCDDDPSCCVWVREHWANDCMLFYDNNVPTGNTPHQGYRSGVSCNRTDTANCPKLWPTFGYDVLLGPPTTTTTGAPVTIPTTCDSTGNKVQYIAERGVKAKGNLLASTGLDVPSVLLCARLCVQTAGCIQWGIDSSGSQAMCNLFDSQYAGVVEANHIKGTLNC